MIETALKLSDSRLLLFGAIVVDTACMGTLALLLTMPAQALSIDSPALLLISLSITAPVLAICVAGSALLVAKTLGSEERARRAILAGTILHLAIQGNVLLGLLCSRCGPISIRSYVLQTATWAFILLVAFVPLVLFLRWKNRRNRLNSVGTVNHSPESTL
jgi:hypothetical protein